jgi:hypothetical protein
MCYKHTRAASIWWKNNNTQNGRLLDDRFDVHDRMCGLILNISGYLELGVYADLIVHGVFAA